MSEAIPRLTETLPCKEAGKCSNCSAPEEVEPLTVFQECDDEDRPEMRFVLLCPSCSDLIEPHARLYHRLVYAVQPGVCARRTRK